MESFCKHIWETFSSYMDMGGWLVLPFYFIGLMSPCICGIIFMCVSISFKDVKKQKMFRLFGLFALLLGIVLLCIIGIILSIGYKACHN